MSLEKINPILSNYKIEKVLGKGTFSTVKLAINIETGEKLAIKILEKNKIRNKRDIKRIEREISMVKNINHINIVKVFEIKEDEQKYYIIMEYCENGELFNMILEKRNLKEEEAAYYYFQIINGLEYIHRENIIHRDLKPENLLLTKNYILKIIDFGLSNYNTYDNLLSTPCGSPCYASPEMVSGEKYNGFTSDVWSTGIILYAMIYGFLPFENLNHNNDLLFQKISECRVNYPRNSSTLAIDLLKKILVPDPNERIKISGIKKHKFYIIGKNIFNNKHTELNFYRKLEIKRTNNYSSLKEDNSKENKYYIDNYNNEKHKNTYNIDYESENFYINKNFDDYNKNNIKKREISAKNNLNRRNYKYKINKRNSKNDLKRNYDITTKNAINSFHKDIIREKNQRKTDIDDDYLYFSNIDNNKNERNTYSNNSKNDINIRNKLYKCKNEGITRKNNFGFGPPLKITKNNNYDLSNLEEERKNGSKIVKIKIENNNFNNIYNQSNKKCKIKNDIDFFPKEISIKKNKDIKLNLIPTNSVRISESKADKKLGILKKFHSKNNLNINSFSIEHENDYFYQALTNSKKISPLNTQKKIIIDINLDNEDNLSKIDCKRNLKRKIKYKDNFVNNTDDIIYKINKRRRINPNCYRKKYSNSVQKKIIGEKNISEEKSKNDESYKISKECIVSNEKIRGCLERDITIKSKNIKNNNNNNFKLKEISPISILNFKQNSNSFLLNTPSPTKNEMEFEILNKNSLNKRQIERNNNSIINGQDNYSLNADLRNRDKNYSLISDSQINDINKYFNNDSFDKIKKVKNNKVRINNHNKSENNNIIYSNIYKSKHINNKSLGENYFKNNTVINKNYNSKEENEKQEKILNNFNEINNAISELNKRRNKKYNNNYIKIISNSRKFKPKRLQKKSSTSVKMDSLPSNICNENIINYGIKKYKRGEEIKFEVQNNSDEKEGNENLKEDKEKLRNIVTNLNNKENKKYYLKKVNYTSKAHNSNIDNFITFNMNKKGVDFYKSDRNGLNINNKEAYTYTHKSLKENKNLSNKFLNDKKKTNTFKYRFLNGEQKVDLHNANNSCEAEKQNKKKIIATNNIITNINKINISNLPSITIDMNILNQNNMKYLKLYDAIKNKL